MMNEPREKLVEFSKRYSINLFKFCDSMIPKAGKRWNVYNKLRQFAGKTCFEWTSLDDNYAITARELSCANLSIGPPGSGRGHTSRVLLPQRTARAIIRARIEPHGAGSCRLLRLQFLLAVTLCHEVMHALDLAMAIHTPVRDKLLIEDYYCDQRLNELGYAWEVAVFGGIVCGMDGLKEDTPIVFANWPNITGTEPSAGIYDLTGYKRSRFSYFVPMQHLSTVQQQTFWETASDDTNLLRLPKTVGWKDQYSGDDFDPDWDS